MWGRFKPSRAAAEVRIVVDLDRLVSEPMGFMLHGQARRIKPMTQETFLRVTNEIAALDMLRLKRDFDPEKLRKAYLSLFEKACEPITDADLKRMTDAQIGALVQNIIECVTGRAQASGEKKTLASR